MAEDDQNDDAMTMAVPSAEMNELLGMFDVPAYVRRGQDLEYTLGRVHARCQRERDGMLEMVRVRLKQWSSAASGPEAWSAVFAASIAPLWPLTAAEAPAWAERPAPLRRQRTIARDLLASVTRFNRRWAEFLEKLDLTHANRLIDDYNRYYLLEKECSLGSARLAARHYSPKARLTVESLLVDHPALPLPELLIC
jgi:hypothetical protein